MSKKKDARKEVTHKKPATNVSDSAKDAVISDEQLDQVAGGINPQPLPPRNPKQTTA